MFFKLSEVQEIMGQLLNPTKMEGMVMKNVYKQQTLKMI